MPTGSIGDSARLYPWQVGHYIARGGPNDPVVATTPAVPAAQTGGGSVSWNTTLTLPPAPGQSAPRTMILNNNGTLTAGQLVNPTTGGGLLIGTIPQGAWITNLMLQCYQTIAGGTSTSVGLFYTNALLDTTYPPATLNLLAYITTPTISNLYSTTTSINATAFTAANAAPGPLGAGVPTTAGAIANLASLSDINIYVAGFLVAGGGTANTAGTYAALIEFTGLEG